jgi:hypothetical protein
MSIAASFTVAKNLKQSRSPSVSEWSNKTLFILTMGLYSAIKKHELFTHAATSVNLKKTRLKDADHVESLHFLYDMSRNL